jgi:hypothetical protein
MSCQSSRGWWYPAACHDVQHSVRRNRAKEPFSIVRMSNPTRT